MKQRSPKHPNDEMFSTAENIIVYESVDKFVNDLVWWDEKTYQDYQGLKLTLTPLNALVKVRLLPVITHRDRPF